MDDDSSVLWRGLESRLERVEDITSGLDEILRGNRRKKIIGLLEEQDRMDADLRKLMAVVFQDSTGKRGLAHDVDVLMDRRSGEDRRSQLKWGFWTAIIVAAMTSATALLTNWDKILKSLPKHNPSPLEKKIEKARHPKSPKKIYRFRIVPPPSEDPGTTQDNPPK